MTQAKGSERTRCRRCGGNGPLTKAGRCAPCTVDLQIQPASKPTAPPSTAPEGIAERPRSKVIYRGFRTPRGARVEWSTDGLKWTPLDPRHNLMNHSPDGFEWGYGGSGPAQLALALVSRVAALDLALRLYQDFKWAVVARLDRNSWEMPEHEIWQWVNAAAGDVRPLAADGKGKP